MAAGLRVDGLGATAVFAGLLDSPTFLAYVEQVLVPTLRPGDVVVLDNLTMRKQHEFQAAIERVGARLRFLPPTVRTSIRSKGLYEAEGVLARRATRIRLKATKAALDRLDEALRSLPAANELATGGDRQPRGNGISEIARIRPVGNQHFAGVKGLNQQIARGHSAGRQVALL